VGHMDRDGNLKAPPGLVFDHVPGRNQRSITRGSFTLSESHQATSYTGKLVTKMCLPTFSCGHPMVYRPGRVMSDVLLMATLQFRNPVQFLV
jgi:hypothetical protein